MAIVAPPEKVILIDSGLAEMESILEYIPVLGSAFCSGISSITAICDMLMI
jgi:hypothetical protein